MQKLSSQSSGTGLRPAPIVISAANFRAYIPREV
jgi:hypothetical protein